MANEGVYDNIADYYLQVAALTPQTEVAPVPVKTTPGQGGMIFAAMQSGLIFVGFAFLALLVTAFRSQKRLATVATIMMIGIITSTIPLGMQLVKEQQSVESQAAVTYQPKDMSVTQVTATSFTVSWKTDLPEIGVVRLRTTKDLLPPMTMLQDPGELMQHSLVAANLKPNTEYYFDILSGGVWYDHDGEPLMVKTAVN
jgi:hypothetical protein